MQRDAQHDAQHADHQENSHAHGDREDEQVVPEHCLFRDGGHLFCENLQIGLSDRDDDADDKGKQRDQPDLARVGHGRTDLLTDDEHGKVRAKHESAKSHDEQKDADEKEQEGPRLQRHERHAEHKHDECNGQDGSE